MRSSIRALDSLLSKCVAAKSLNVWDESIISACLYTLTSESIPFSAGASEPVASVSASALAAKSSSPVAVSVALLDAAASELS